MTALVTSCLTYSRPRACSQSERLDRRWYFTADCSWVICAICAIQLLSLLNVLRLGLETSQIVEICHEQKSPNGVETGAQLTRLDKTNLISIKICSEGIFKSKGVIFNQKNGILKLVDFVALLISTACWKYQEIRKDVKGWRPPWPSRSQFLLPNMFHTLVSANQQHASETTRQPINQRFSYGYLYVCLID